MMTPLKKKVLDHSIGILEQIDSSYSVYSDMKSQLKEILEDKTIPKEIIKKIEDKISNVHTHYHKEVTFRIGESKKWLKLLQEEK